MSRLTPSQYEIQPGEITFTEPLSGRESEIVIQQAIAERGSGHFGAVHEVEIEMFSETAKHESQREIMVLKICGKPEQVEHAARMYAMCYRAGLRVVTTFRFNAKERLILTTPMHRDDQKYIGAYPQSVDAHNLPKLKMSLDDILAFARQIYIAAMCATRKNIILPSDGFLFLINKDNDPASVVAYVGDFDNVDNNLDRKPGLNGVKPKPYTPRQLALANLKSAAAAVFYFLANYQDSQSDEDIRATLKHLEEASRAALLD